MNQLFKDLSKQKSLKFGQSGRALVSLGAMAAYMYGVFGEYGKQNECCGIVGYIGNQPITGDVCMKGLKILESRGYDSCGIVSIDK